MRALFLPIATLLLKYKCGDHFNADWSWWQIVSHAEFRTDWDLYQLPRLGKSAVSSKILAQFLIHWHDRESRRQIHRERALFRFYYSSRSIVPVRVTASQSSCNCATNSQILLLADPRKESIVVANSSTGITSGRDKPSRSNFRTRIFVI